MSSNGNHNGDYNGRLDADDDTELESLLKSSDVGNHRYEALLKLTLKCAWCPENRIKVLQIDHIHNDGKGKRATQWKADTVDPARNQVLCIACNWLKQQYVNVYKKKTGKKPNFVITSEMVFKQFGRPAQLQAIPELTCRQCEQNERDWQAPDVSVLLGKPRSEVSKMQLFMDILRRLQDDRAGGPVEHEVLVKALVDTEKFTTDDASNFIKKLHRDGMIYESERGCYSRN